MKPLLLALTLTVPSLTAHVTPVPPPRSAQWTLPFDLGDYGSGLARVLTVIITSSTSASYLVISTGQLPIGTIAPYTMGLV